MKKKIIIILAVLIPLTVAMVIAITAGLQYKYRQDNRVTIGIQPYYNEDGKSYRDGFVYWIDDDTWSDKTKQNFNKFASDAEEFRKNFENTYEAPYQVRATVETPKGKTIVHFIGTAVKKQTGETENINVTYEYDFVLIRYAYDLQRTDGK